MPHPSRSLRLDAITRSLLLAMGVSAPLACGGQVTAQGGSGGPDGSGGHATSSTDVSVSVSATSSTGGSSDMCINPQPVIIEGLDVGLDLCTGGQYRRRAQVVCPEGTVPPDGCCGPCPDGFICEGGGFECECVEVCQADVDCGNGQLCFCSEAGGRCITSSCATDADCPGGQACTSWDPTQGCGPIEFDCTSPDDECGGTLDCNQEETCYREPDGIRACLHGGCAVGRPFLVHGQERTAPFVARIDWCADTLDLNGLTDDLDTDARQRLAEHWSRVGAMEHASIASFARFALQLLALGAPPDLLERTHRALADETRHARAAFALASAYAGHPVSPGPLAVSDAMHGALNVERFVALLIEEGCIGETVAALEAAESAPTHPAVDTVLSAIAAEEAEHAELAWRALAWVLETHLAPARRAAVALRSALARDPASSPLRAQVIEQVVTPCLDALLARGPVMGSNDARRRDATV